ncbi:MAG TPA: hypothetical protein VK203_06230 [Nostocaceae cyanobacterium]|nr:hypothetical protein [Nostocaceae cyanobacterium]
MNTFRLKFPVGRSVKLKEQQYNTFGIGIVIDWIPGTGEVNFFYHVNFVILETGEFMPMWCKECEIEELFLE